MADRISRRPAPASLGSDKIFGTARRWIEECHSDHETCHYDANALLPTRVIDVGSEKTEATSTLHLAEEGERGAYVALSYCWGNSQHVLAKEDNIERLIKGIDNSRLPRTIQDAIEATRRLGIRFLWVDALCIIQDRPADKEREIQNMGHIYKHATVTIAAAAAKTSSEGFLRLEPAPPRAETASRGFLRLERAAPPTGRFQFHLPGEGDSTVFVASVHAPPRHPLDSRGWALQEFLLSPRLLVFARHEVLWYCQTKQSVPAINSWLGYSIPLRRLPSELFNKSLCTDENRTMRSRTKDIKLWQIVVEQYSARTLSDPDDRLNALAGVANELGNLWQDLYIFGSWKSCFIELLAWYTRNGGYGPRHHRSARAPSWSWISMSCAIYFRKEVGAEASVVSFSEDSRAVMLRCKSVATSTFRHIEDDSSFSYNRYFDAVSEDTALDKVQYLLLGSVKSHLYRVAGIMTIAVGERDDKVQRRVGYFDVQSGVSHITFWDSVEYRIYELV